MRNLSLILFSTFLLIKASVASEYSSDPKMFIGELVNDAIVKLSDKTVSKEEKVKYIEEIAIANVDIKALGLYTLGEIRKTADKTSLDNYQKSFQKYFLKSLTSRLTDYSSNKFEVIDAEIKSANYTMVKSKILENENQPEIKIDWRIYTKNPSKPLIRDLIVEGLSLARTQKEEFKSIMQNNDDDINFLFKSFEEFLIK